jgi:chromosome segregation ATPase
MQASSGPPTRATSPSLCTAALSLVLLAVQAGSPVALLAGCGTERAECGALATKINAGSERLKAFEAERKDRRSLGAKTTAQEMRKLADIYTELAADVGTVAVKSPELKLHAERYQAALRRSGDSARTLATAIDNNQRSEAATADGIFAGSVKEQEKSLDLINTQCGGR